MRIITIKVGLTIIKNKLICLNKTIIIIVIGAYEGGGEPSFASN